MCRRAAQYGLRLSYDDDFFYIRDRAGGETRRYIKREGDIDFELLLVEDWLSYFSAEAKKKKKEKKKKI